MPNLPKKPIHPIAEGLPIDRPSGENFFVATVQIANPDDSCWGDGFNVVDSWEAVSKTVSKYLTFAPTAKYSTVGNYQGDTVRRKMVEGLVD